MLDNRKIFILVVISLVLSGCFDSDENMSIPTAEIKKVVNSEVSNKKTKNSKKIQKRLFNIIRKGDDKTLVKLIKEGVSLTQRSFKGATPLHLAAGLKNSKIVKILLEAGANPDMKNKFGLKPIAYVKNKEIFNILQKVTTFKNNDPSFARVDCSLFVWKYRNIAKKPSCVVSGKYYQDHKAYWQSAWFYLMGGDFKASIEANKLAQKNGENDVRIAKVLGHAYVLNGEFKKAKESYSYFYLKESQSNTIMNRNYVFLNTLFKDKASNLKKGKKIWKEISGESI